MIAHLEVIGVVLVATLVVQVRSKFESINAPPRLLQHMAAKRNNTLDCGECCALCPTSNPIRGHYFSGRHVVVVHRMRPLQCGSQAAHRGRQQHAAARVPVAGGHYRWGRWHLLWRQHNFGPAHSDCRTLCVLVSVILGHFSGELCVSSRKVNWTMIYRPDYLVCFWDYPKIFSENILWVRVVLCISQKSMHI